MIPIFINKMLPDKIYIQIMFFYHKHQFVNFKNPKTFSEKQQWLKLYNRRNEYITMADKYLVRNYIKETIGEQYLIPLVGGPWNNSNEIDLSLLPDKFVLKCSNGHGVEICKDKNNFDFESVKKRLNKALKNNLYWYGREWPYKGSISLIIAEEYLQDNITDYKFYCFNGEPKYLFIVTDRMNGGPYGDLYDINGNHLPVIDVSFPNNPYGIPSLPKSFEEMKYISQKLSKNIPFVRIDLYEKDDKPLFGEMTFFDSAGFSSFYPKEFDLHLGTLIKLPGKK